jgi:hypothetical protein
MDKSGSPRRNPSDDPRAYASHPFDPPIPLHEDPP